MAVPLGVVSIVVLLVCPTAIYCSNVTVNPSSSSCSQPCGSVVNGTSIDQALGDISSGDYLRLLPGCHCVRTFSVVKDVTDVSLIGDDGGGGIVQITCAPGLGLAFLNVTRLSFQRLTITGCGLNGSNAVSLNTAINTIVDLFIQLAEDINIALVIASCTNVVMDHVTIVNTTGLGLVGVNVAGESSFTNNVFSFNMGEECFVLNDNIGQPKNTTVGGGAQLIYVDYINQSSSSSSPVYLNIDNNTFSNNSHCGSELVLEIKNQFIRSIQNGSYHVGAGGGLSLSLAQREYSVDVKIQRSSFENNTATIGSAVAILWYAGVQNTSVVLSDCIISYNGLVGLKNNGILYVTQGGVAVIKDIAVPFRPRPNLLNAPNTVTILRTNFTGNAGYIGSCVYAFSLYSTQLRLFDSQPNQVILDSCHFENNSGNLGTIFMGYEEKATGLQSGLVVQMQRCTVIGNRVNKSYVNSLSSPLALVQLFAMNITIKDTSFLNNNGTAVGGLTSLVILEGGVEFVNNFALAGGAMLLSSQTFLLVKNNSKVSFTNNSAYAGGAIYTDYTFGEFVDSSYNDCFMYFDYIVALCTAQVPCPDLSVLNISMVFSNNKAYLGGILYGSTMDSCSWVAGVKKRYNQNCSILEALYNLNENKTLTILQLDQRPNTSSVISTKTSALNFDNSSTSIFSCMPGQQFSVRLQSVDRLNHTVPTVVTARSQGVSPTISQLGGSGFWLTLANGSSNVPTKVYGQQNTTVSITVYSLDSFVQSQSLTVSLGNCAFGFGYNATSMDCQCRKATVSSKVTCDPDLKVFNVTYGSWFGPGPDGVGVVYGRCLLDYCKGVAAGSVLPQAIDAQCANNRRGLLCGGCQEGYSAVFGTNRCMKCSDNTLGLLVFFAAAGVGIIAIILFLHVTVAEGYITGVVFYSGVVVTYATVQGGAREALIPLYFLNLNIGFETCFYDGMTPLDRAGLGLVFPAYLFVLMILFIWLASRFLLLSEWLAKSNFTPSKLVATLIVLSYNSITQSCFQILGFVEVTVYRDDGSSHVIRPWATDPNEEYFSPKHTVLFVICAVLLVIYVLPVPILLVLPSCTSRGVWRFKPLYDVFFNPFRDNFTFWLGVCLVIRIVIFTISSFFASPDSTLYLGVVLMSAVFLKSVIQPFKFPVHNVLDVFFLINLLVVSMGSLYFQGLDVTREAYRTGDVQSSFVAFLMSVVGLAYVVICAVVVVHFYIRFPNLCSSCKPWPKKQYAMSYTKWSGPETSKAIAIELTPKSKKVTTTGGKVVTFSTAGISDD